VPWRRRCTKWHSNVFFSEYPGSPLSKLHTFHHLPHCGCAVTHTAKQFRVPAVLTVLCHRGADFGELYERAIDRCKPADPLKQFRCQYEFLLIGSMGGRADVGHVTETSQDEAKQTLKFVASLISQTLCPLHCLFELTNEYNEH
jgi:hypothetical protein